MVGRICQYSSMNPIINPAGLRRAMVLAMLLAGAAGPVSSQTDWGWKQNRDVLAAVVTGRVDASIEKMRSIHREYPDNIETVFGLAVALAGAGEVEEALRFARLSLELGISPERWLAGPVVLTAPVLAADPDLARQVRAAAGAILHGPHLGHVTENSIQVWARVATASAVHVEASTDPGFGWVQSKASSTVALSDAPRVIRLTLDGLQPGRTYFYRLIAGDGVRSDPGFVFRTAHAPASGRAFSAVFGGGAAYEPQFEHMWHTIRDQKADMLFLLGDNVYIDQPELPVIQEYCYIRRHSSRPYRELLAGTPVYAIWDDHDFCVNDGWGGPDVDKPAWKKPVYELFAENWVNPGYGNPPANPGCYFSFSRSGVDFFFLDGRYYRTDPRAENPSMLGPVQLQWLKDRLSESRRIFKVIASPVCFAPGVKPGSLDPWDGYPEEREEIFRFIEEHRIPGVVFISADRHRSDIWKIRRPDANGGYDFYEFCSSRLTNIHLHSVMEDSLFGYNRTCSFGRLDFDPNADDPSVTYSIHTIDGREVYRRIVYQSELRPPRRQ